MKYLFITQLILSFLANSNSYSQTPIDVTDQTLKIGAMKDEILYFGFAEGDQIILNFVEEDGKELKEIEVMEYPSISKFSDFKITEITDKMITVNRKGVYSFRFSNGSVTGKICKIKIQRIPLNDLTKNFNTNITWMYKQDTTWNTYTKDVLVGYDTIFHQLTKKEIVSTEYEEVLLLDKNQRVHTEYNSAGNKSYVFFSLPASVNETYKTSKVNAWAYRISVGKEGEDAWQKDRESLSGLAEGVAAIYTTPIGAFAIGKITSLMIPTGGDDVHYSLTDKSNAELFFGGSPYNLWDKGIGTGGYKKYVDAAMCKGTFYILLSNDNIADPIDVSVKVSAIVETNIYEFKPYTEEIVKPRYDKKIFSDPVIRSSNVPVIGL